MNDRFRRIFIHPLLFTWAVFFAGTFGARAAVTLSVNPPAVSNFYSGVLTFQITGLTNGEPVVLEKFNDANKNSTIDPGELMVQSFNLTDGQISVFGGVTNVNVPGDMDPAGGSIRAQLPMQSGPNQGVGNYIFRLRSPSGRFTPQNSAFAITNTGFGQSISGAVVNGTNVPSAFVILLNGNGNFISGAMADTGGNYLIKAAPGTYQLVALKPGFAGTFASAPTVTLSSGASVTANVTVTAVTQTIAARLIDAGTSNGIAGIFFFMESTSGLATIGYTDTNGNVTVSVSSGQWKMRTESDALSPLGYLALNGKMNVDTTTGNVAGITFAVPKASALFYGTLKNSTNGAMAGIQISGNTQDNIYKSSGYTDAGGYYTMGASGTNWNLGPSSDVLGPLGYFSAGTNTSVNAGQALRVDFVAQATTASFNGRVVDESGTPLANMGVNANNNGSKNVNSQTDANGNFTLRVSADTWNIQLSSGDAAQRNLVGPSLVYTIIDGQNFSNIVLVARTAVASISGSVKDGTNGAVANIGVSANATVNNTNYNNYVTTDAGGNYSLLVINGSWNVNLDCYSLSQRNFSCPNGQMATISGGGATLNFVVYGPPVGNFSFRFFKTAGDFGSGFTPPVTFPTTLGRYQAAFIVTDTNPATTASFTGPGGSGLTNTAAEVVVTTNNGPSFYFSPRLLMPAANPAGGMWTVQYKGAPNVFSNVPDPQQNSRFAVPLPTVTVANDILRSISWTYYTSTGGTYGGPPAFVSSNMVEVFDQNGNFYYQSPFLSRNATSFTFDQVLNWSQVSSVRMRYLDSLTNYYFVIFNKSQPNIVGATRTGSQIQFNVNAFVGSNYSIQYSTNLSTTNWTTLLVTNVTLSPITFVDPSPTDKARFYRVLVGP